MKQIFTQTTFTKAVLITLSIFFCMQISVLQAQVLKTFQQRTSTYSPNQKIYNIKGDYEMIGNTNLTFSDPSNGSNNNANMVFVDADDFPQTLNSSSATLQFSGENGADPTCSNIIYAGLYWMGRAHIDSSPNTFSVTKTGIPGTGTPQNVDYYQNTYDGAVSTYTGYSLVITRSGGNNNRTITYSFRPGTSPGGNRVDFVYAHNSGNQTLTVSVNQGTATPISTSSIDANTATLSSPYVVYNPSGGVAIEVISLHRNGNNASVGGSYAYLHIHGTYTPTGSVTKNYDKSVVYLKHGSTTGYTQINAQDLNFATDIYYPSGTAGNMYAGYAEITDYVRQHGVGQYTVADIALNEGNGGGTGFFGGWSMIVVYENSKMNWRDVTIFDGYAYIQGSTTIAHTLPISGFHTAQNGPINLKLGVFAGEGDRGISGDYFQILPHDKMAPNPPASDYVNLSISGYNTADNFFNSSITTPIASRNPGIANNSGIDIAVFNIANTNNSLITNNQTATEFRYGSTQDTYIIPVIAMAVDAYIPELAPFIEVTQVNGQPYSPTNFEVLPNQDITFTINLKNPGNEAVHNGIIRIPIPYNASYISSSAQYYLGTGGLNPLQPYFANTPPTGEIVWDIGDVPHPANPDDLLATLTFTLKATNDCFLLVNQSCDPIITITGTASGIGEHSQTIFHNLRFVTGYGTGACSNEPITGPLNVRIDATDYVNANCGSNVGQPRVFNFCYNGASTTINFNQIAGQFPAGSRFYSAVITETDPVSGQSYVVPAPGATEYTSTNNFSNAVGENTYYAIPPGVSTCWWEFKIAVSNCNLWYGTNSEDWGTASNWTGNTVPGPNDDVVFATVANYGSHAIRDLVLDINRSARDVVNLTPATRLIIPEGKTLVIQRDANTGSEAQVVLKAKKGIATGALIFNDLTLNQSVGATVEFASISKPAVGQTWPRTWQYFGSPVRNKTLTQLFGTDVQGSIYGGNPSVNTIVRKYDETLNLSGNNQEKWNDVALTDVVQPYYGYEITQPQLKFDNADTSPYHLPGSLVTDVSFTVPMTISPTGVYSRGNYILANPYAAPIFISNLTTADFENLDPTIYIYNTGSRQDWISNNGHNQLGVQPGTYTSIPISAANTIGQTQIPSMQGFLVKAISGTAPSTSFKFRYATVYRGSLTYPNEPMRVRSASGVSSSTGIKPLIKMDVIGANSSDRVYLITAENTTKSYDPSWDGTKSLSSGVVQLFAIDADTKKMQVNTDSDLNGTYIGFRSGGESNYTLKFTFNEEMAGVYEELFIHDLFTNEVKPITEGMTMNFASTGSTDDKRFMISARKIITGIGNLQGGDEPLKLVVNAQTIKLDNNTNEDVTLTVYNLVGQPILVRKLGKGIQQINHSLSNGSYIVEARTSKGEKLIKKSVIER